MVDVRLNYETGLDRVTVYLILHLQVVLRKLTRVELPNGKTELQKQ